jgi:hypothetical protein
LARLFVVPEEHEISDLNTEYHFELNESLPVVHWSQDNVLVWRVDRDAVARIYNENKQEKFCNEK